MLREGAFESETYIVTGGAQGIGHHAVGAIADPLLFGYATGQVFALNGGMSMQ